MAATAALENAHAGAYSSQSAKPFASGDMACPDPSAHGRDKKLQEQASTAALYVTHPDRTTNIEQKSPLGSDGKLSSASMRLPENAMDSGTATTDRAATGAATSLKYARAQELPSFPVVGIDTANSAGSAALLAAGNKTKIEWWKPDGTSDSAAKAALLAKDYKMAPLWQPELSAAGSKAALLAHRDSTKLNLWMPEASADGNSAAGIAMRNKTLSPQPDYGYSDTGKRNALTAATGAVAARNRKRAESSPAPLPNYPDAANSAHNSLNAATVAHRPSVKKPNDTNRTSSEAMQSARITNIGANVPKEMFGATPPVSIEVEEQRRQAALRASAISMAKNMYDTQQHAINEAAGISNIGETAARGASARPMSIASSTTSPADLRTQALQYMKVQSQAQRLAAERLAKLDADGTNDFRDYYGYGSAPKRSRLSVRRGRRRASSDSRLIDSDDEEQSRRIRDQMSIFNTKLAQVDAKKRQKDRENLLAAAERKVLAQMHTMDEKVFMETGKVPPAIMEEWEAKARAKASEQSEKRMENHGKVHVGGGKFLDQSEIDAVAASKVAPTLNEISDAAEAKRAQDEERRLEEEERKRLAAVEKEREAERKAEEKRIKSELKAEEKSRKAHEKATAKAEKEIEKVRRDEEKRLKQEEKRKSKAEQEEHEDHSDAPMTVLEPRPVTSSTHRDERPAPLAEIPSYQREVEAIGEVASSDEEDKQKHTVDPVEESHQTRRVATAPATTIETPTHNENNKSAKDISFSAPTSPIDHTTSPKEGGSRGLKSFFTRLKRRSHLGRSKEKSEKVEPGTLSHRSSFIGGAALRSQSSLAATRDQPSAPEKTTPVITTPPARRSSPSISSLESGEIARTSSGGGFAGSWSSRGRQRSAATGVSSVSNGVDDDEEQFVDAGESLEPPPRLTTKRSTESPQRDSRFMERF